jgi:hypothetical protein
LLRRIHAGCAHSGKVPVAVKSRVKTIRQLDQLKEELQQRIINEEFEAAALLRDQIRALEADMTADQDEHDCLTENKTAENSTEPVKKQPDVDHSSEEGRGHCDKGEEQ